MDILPAIFFFLLGAAAGSFVNVAILRFGYAEIPSPRSECPHCGKRIFWYDLLPIVSYLFLGGKCRFCGSALTIQYLAVEVALGVLFVLSYLFYPPLITPLSLIGFFALLAFWAAFIAIVTYDLRHTLIPLSFVFVLWAAAIIRRATEGIVVGDIFPLSDAFFGALALGGFFLLVSLITRGKGMGIGDSYVAAGVGALLGLLRGIEAAAFGVWIGTLVSLILLFSSQSALFGSGRQVTMKTELPFAPWLFVGTCMALFSGLSVFAFSDYLTRLIWL